MRRLLTGALAAAFASTAAGAIGLGPLRLDGATAGPRRGFNLQLINSDRDAATLVAYAVGVGDETPDPRVRIWPARARLAANGSRRLFVIAEDLAPGEVRRFRVCAEREDEDESVTLRARVCAKLTATRLGVQGANGAS